MAHLIVTYYISTTNANKDGRANKANVEGTLLIAAVRFFYQWCGGPGRQLQQWQRPMMMTVLLRGCRCDMMIEKHSIESPCLRHCDDDVL
jgi:hypothetical protein